MTTKPPRIEKVKGCYSVKHGACPFYYVEKPPTSPAFNAGELFGLVSRCNLGGRPDRYPKRDYPPDCPLITSNICVELEE